MTIEDRKEREKEEMRSLILETASEIVSKEGFDKLSIRKIAAKIDYSPAIIYHYFRDKEDILNHVMGKGYQKIVNALASVQISSHHPEQVLREMARNYINAALKMSDDYFSVQLNSSPAILEHTASMFKGASSKKPALGILFKCLKEIYKDKNIDDDFIEMTAQIISASSFGLIIRLILERNKISEEQKQNLIDHYIKSIIDGMILGKPLFDCSKEI